MWQIFYNFSYCSLLTQNSGQTKISRDRPIWQTFAVMLSIKWMDEQMKKRIAEDPNAEKGIRHVLWVERREEHYKKGDLRVGVKGWAGTFSSTFWFFSWKRGIWGSGCVKKQGSWTERQQMPDLPQRAGLEKQVSLPRQSASRSWEHRRSHLAQPQPNCQHRVTQTAGSTEHAQICSPLNSEGPKGLKMIKLRFWVFFMPLHHDPFLHASWQWWSPVRQPSSCELLQNHDHICLLGWLVKIT